MKKLKDATVCVIGLGLVGGSLALALKAAAGVRRLHGVDVDPRVLRSAVSRGAVDRAGLEPATEVADADLVVLAVPILKAPVVLEAIAPHLPPGCVLTDVLSTKAYVMSLFAQALPSGVDFVGGHPMAGSTRSGLDNARPDLFQGAPFIITPGKRTSQAAIDLVSEMAETLGCRPVRMTPEEHDRIVARISHLPYLVATALSLAVDQSPASRYLAASGFRDTTRLAGCDPEVAGDMCLTNVAELREAGRQFLSRARKLFSALKADEQHFRTTISRAADCRRELAREKGWDE